MFHDDNHLLYALCVRLDTPIFFFAIRTLV
jgi:hypothetical protein